MPVDRPDPADQPANPQTDQLKQYDSCDTPKTARRLLPDSVDRQAAYHAYRTKVDIAAAVHHWTEVLPELQTAWKQHQERTPGQRPPTPENHTDGSWSCGETRKLTRDQNTEVTLGYTRLREVGERDITPAIQAVESADPTRKLVGLDHRIKGEDRLKEKVADRIRAKGRTPEQALAEVADVVRFTFQYREETYASGASNDVKRLEEHGFAKVEIRNTWIDDQYKGVNSRWRELRSGALFEVQFHTQASLEAKELTHQAYERIRTTTRDDERGELKEFQHRVNSEIPIPPGVGDIEDYPPKGK